MLPLESPSIVTSTEAELSGLWEVALFPEKKSASLLKLKIAMCVYTEKPKHRSRNHKIKSFLRSTSRSYITATEG